MMIAPHMQAYALALPVTAASAASRRREARPRLRQRGRARLQARERLSNEVWRVRADGARSDRSGPSVSRTRSIEGAD